MSISRYTCIGLLAVSLVAALPIQRSEATIVAPGERLQFFFEFASTPSLNPAFGPIDTLAFFVFAGQVAGAPQIPFADIGLARLYDGATLLGEDHFILSRNSFDVAAFVAPTSLFTMRNPGAVGDFSSLVDGTIDGILEISFSGYSGPIDFGLQVWAFGHGDAPSGIAAAAPFPVVTGSRLIPLVEVSEPATLLLFGAALALMIMRRLTPRRQTVAAQSLSSIA